MQDRGNQIVSAPYVKEITDVRENFKHPKRGQTRIKITLQIRKAYSFLFYFESDPFKSSDLLERVGGRIRGFA